MPAPEHTGRPHSPPQAHRHGIDLSFCNLCRVPNFQKLLVNGFFDGADPHRQRNAIEPYRLTAQGVGGALSLSLNDLGLNFGGGSSKNLAEQLAHSDPNDQQPRSPESGSSVGGGLKQMIRKMGFHMGLSSARTSTSEKFPGYSSNTRLAYSKYNVDNCGVELKDIVSLSLQSNPLSEITEELIQLPNLERLILRDLSIDYLPEFIFNLNKLTYFDIGKNCLRILPSEITQTKIKTLIIDENRFISGIPNKVYEMKSLTHLNANNTSITGEINNEIQKLTNLESLELHCCAITNFSNVTNLKSLTYLDLSENEIYMIPKTIHLLAKLEYLNLSSNNLIVLASEICELPNLKILDLSFNSIKSLPDNFGNLKCLESLDLNSNKLTHLPNSLGQCIELNSIDLASNSLNSIPGTFRKLSHLKTLNLSSNQLNSACFGHLTWLESLETLNLCSNEIKKIPEIISNFSALREFYVQANLIESIEYETFLKAVVFMDISANPISQFPAPFIEKGKFTLLKLSENQIGPKPSLEKIKDDRSGLPYYKVVENTHESSQNTASAEGTTPKKKVTFTGLASFDITISEEEKIAPRFVYHEKPITLHITRENTSMLGLSLRGGIDSIPIKGDDHGIMVHQLHVESDLYAHGVRENYKIISLNGKSFKKIKHNKAVQAFKELKKSFTIEILPYLNSILDIARITKRQEPIGVLINNSREIVDFPFGFVEKLDDKMVEGIYIVKIFEGTPADLCDNINVGDRLLAINGRSLEGLNMVKIVHIFQDLINTEYVELAIQHFPLPPFYKRIHITREHQNLPFGLVIIGGADSEFKIEDRAFSGIYIKNIVHSEDVSYSETKILGNQIITVDDVCVLGMALTDFFEIIRNCGCITEMTLIAGISVSKLPDDNDNPESSEKCQSEYNESEVDRILHNGNIGNMKLQNTNLNFSTDTVMPDNSVCCSGQSRDKSHNPKFKKVA